MPKLVNVVLSTGDVVAVPEELAAGLQPESGAQQAARGAVEGQAERHSGVAGTVGAALEGAADTLSFGGYGKLEGLISPEAARMSSERAEEHPYARLTGEAGALLVPGLGEVGAPGLARAAGEGIEGLVAGTRLSPLTASAAAVASAAGRATEGAVLGLGGYVAQSNVTGDPLTIQGALADAGIAAVLNVGAGALVDSLRGAGRRARAAVTESERAAAAEAADAETAEKTRKLFSQPPPSWDDFRESYGAAQKSAEQFNRQVAREAADYGDFVNGSKLGSAADATQDVINKLQNERYAARNANVQWIEGKPRGVMTAYDAAGADRTVLTNSAPPISDELAGRLKDYQSRMSRVYKLEAGGWNLDAAGKWVKASGVEADPQRALEELRAIQTDLKAEFPKASHELGRWGDLPETPRDPVPTTGVKLPKTLQQFTRMGADKVNTLAKGLDPASATAFQKLAGDLGLEAKPDIVQSVTGAHKSLGDMASELERVTTAATKKAGATVKATVLNFMGRGAGGLLGGAGGYALGGPVGGFVGRHVGSALGGVLLAGKAGASAKLADIVAKYAVPAAAGVNKLRPVASWLSTSFPSGQHDPERDPRKLARNRITEIRQAMITAPDNSYAAVQPLLGTQGNLALKMHQQVLNAVSYLNAVAPKDPGLDTTVLGSNWLPSNSQALTLAHQLEAVQDPYGAINRLMAGRGNPVAADALQRVWGALMQEHAAQLSMQAAQYQHASPAQAAALSMLMRTPMSGMQNPLVAGAIQNMYAQAAAKAQPQPAAPSKPPGRPPAVQNRVAGSNVADLISQ